MAPGQLEQLARRDDDRLRIMVHGGDPSLSEKLQGGLTKRQQIRSALETVPYVSGVVFAEKPEEEPDLFEECDGTIILIERNTEQRGAWYELAMHAGQRGSSKKLGVFIPDGGRVIDLEGGRFLATFVERRLNPLYQWRYTDFDYEQCRLVTTARDFVDSLRGKRFEDLLLPPAP